MPSKSGGSIPSQVSIIQTPQHPSRLLGRFCYSGFVSTLVVQKSMIDTFKELPHSLTSNVQTGVANPLHGAFIVSWIVFKFRSILALAGDDGVREKIAFIESTLCSTAEWSSQIGFVHPL